MTRCVSSPTHKFLSTFFGLACLSLVLPACGDEDDSGSDKKTMKDSGDDENASDEETGSTSDGESGESDGGDDSAETDGGGEETSGGEAGNEGEDLCDWTPSAKEPAGCEPLDWVGAPQGDDCADDMRLCPVGSVAVGVRVNAGDSADMVSLICRTYEDGALGEETVAAHLCGGFGGTPVDYRCDSDKDGVVVGQRIWNSDALNPMGGSIRTVGAICQEVGGGDTYDVGEAPAMDAANERTDQCPDGKTVWGIDLNTGHWTDAVRMLCGEF